MTATTPAAGTPGPPPQFSVIVPTLGREDGLRVALASLTAQSLPRDRFEILVAFDGVTPTPASLAACALAGAVVVRLDVRRGPGAARNAAVAMARGAILAFTEDDCVADRDWLKHAARRFDEQPSPDALDGLTEKPGGKPVRRKAGTDPLYLPTNLFVRRERFLAAGGYCEDFYDADTGIYFREDSDFGFALEESGARIVRDRTVKVLHPDEHARFLDPLRWARRFVMDPLLARRHPRLFEERIEVLTLGPFKLRRPFVRACMLFVIGLVVLAAGLLMNAAPVAKPSTGW